MSGKGGYSNQAARVSPPAQPTTLALSTTSSAAQGPLKVDAWYSFQCASPFKIVFGGADVAAADTDSWEVQGGNVEWPRQIVQGMEYFRVIVDSGTPTLKYVRSDA